MVYEDPKITWCLRCMKGGVVGPYMERHPLDSLLADPPAVSARELLRTRHSTFVPKAYPAIRLAMPSMIAAYSPPGGGKTMFSLQLGHSLEPCIYLPLEEKIGASLSAKLEYLELFSEQLTFHEPTDVQGIVSLAATPGLRSMIVDSVNMTVLQANDALRICRNNNIVLVLILQCTKTGQARGSRELTHLADVVVRVENLEWLIEKSRFQQSGLRGPVL